MEKHRTQDNVSLELSLGHAILAGTMQADEALDYMSAYFEGLEQPLELPENWGERPY